MSSPICIYGNIINDIQLIRNYIINYEELCLVYNYNKNENMNDKNEIKTNLIIKTKYYIANLNILLNGNINNMNKLDNGCECCILVNSSNEVIKTIICFH